LAMLYRNAVSGDFGFAPNPSHRLCRAAIDQPGRHPHHQTGKLLVLDSGEVPQGRADDIGRRPEP
jgi:hypothetical protein